MSIPTPPVPSAAAGSDRSHSTGRRAARFVAGRRAYRRRATRRGFTLIEAAVTSALASALLLVVLSWVGAIGDLASQSPARQHTRRNAFAVESYLIADVDRAGPCDAARLASPLEEIGANTMTLHLDTDADGVVDRVRWDHDGTSLTRTVWAGVGNCVFSTEPNARTVATDVRAGGGAHFAAVLGGIDVTSDGMISCSAVPDPCRFDGVRVRAVLDPGAGGPQAILRTLVFRQRS
jgi:hypothetical protein